MMSQVIPITVPNYYFAGLSIVRAMRKMEMESCMLKQELWRFILSLGLFVEVCLVLVF